MDHISSSAAPARPRRDLRIATLLALCAAVALLGYVFSLMPGRGVSTDAPKTPAKEAAGGAGFSSLAASSADVRQEMLNSLSLELAPDAKNADWDQARQILKQAEGMLKQRQVEKAIATLNESVELLRKYPETYLLLGRALEAKKDYATARDFYNAAIDRDPYMADAYWGFATASEGLNDLEAALGAMRNYLHMEPNRDPGRLRIAQARSALWEWEAKLARGPWGETKGIPPGFTADEVKRDGKGVGTKIPIPGTEGPDGAMKSEIKSGKKIELFRKP